MLIFLNFLMILIDRCLLSRSVCYEQRLAITKSKVHTLWLVMRLSQLTGFELTLDKKLV